MAAPLGETQGARQCLLRPEEQQPRKARRERAPRGGNGEPDQTEKINLTSAVEVAESPPIGCPTAIATR